MIFFLQSMLLLYAPEQVQRFAEGMTRYRIVNLPEALLRFKMGHRGPGERFFIAYSLFHFKKVIGSRRSYPHGRAVLQLIR